MINPYAILLSAIASMVIGSIWYGPLFGKRYIALMGMDKLTKKEQAKMKKRMAWLYLGQFVASLVMFFVLALLIGELDLLTAVSISLLVWIGFIVPVEFGNALWGGKMALFWLGIGNMLLTLLAAGAIIGAMN
jgi:hypothetical protein